MTANSKAVIVALTRQCSFYRNETFAARWALSELLFVGALLAAPVAAIAQQGEKLEISELPEAVQQAANKMTTDVNWLFGMRVKINGESLYRVLGKDAHMHFLFAEITADGKPNVVRTKSVSNKSGLS